MKSKSKNLLNCKININNYFLIVIGIFNHNKYRVVEGMPFLQCNLKKMFKIKEENHKNLLLIYINKMRQSNNNSINNLLNKINKYLEERRRGS